MYCNISVAYSILHRRALLDVGSLGGRSPYFHEYIISMAGKASQMESDAMLFMAHSYCLVLVLKYVREWRCGDR